MTSGQDSEATLVSRTPKRKSPGDKARDLRRAAERNAKHQTELRQARIDEAARTDQVNEFAARSLDRRQRDLEAGKLRLRREVRVTGGLPPEGATFDGRRV